MARAAQRHIEERIFDILKTARELKFKVVIGDPVVGPEDLQRVEPPIRPGEEAHLTFYIGAKAWERFRCAYLIFMTPERQTHFLAGIEIVVYKPTPENTDGTSGT